MFLYYVKFDKLKKKGEFLTYALIGDSIEAVMEQAAQIGENPVVIGEPTQLNPDWL